MYLFVVLLTVRSEMFMSTDCTKVFWWVSFEVGVAGQSYTDWGVYCDNPTDLPASANNIVLTCTYDVYKFEYNQITADVTVYRDPAQNLAAGDTVLDHIPTTLVSGVVPSMEFQDDTDP